LIIAIQKPSITYSNMAIVTKLSLRVIGNVLHFTNTQLLFENVSEKKNLFYNNLLTKYVKKYYKIHR